LKNNTIYGNLTSQGERFNAQNRYPTHPRIRNGNLASTWCRQAGHSQRRAGRGLQHWQPKAGSLHDRFSGSFKKATANKIKYDLIEYPDSYPADEPMRRSPDIRKAHLQLGFEPIVDIEDGLARFLSWTDEVYIGEQ
jgi:nucleoside-diphosphate-sugar epimerase